MRRRRSRRALRSRTVLGLALILSCGGCASRPSDHELLKRFAAHREDFALLAAMAREDSTLQILVDGTAQVRGAGHGVPAAVALGGDRSTEYERLFRKLGVAAIQWQDSTGTWFWAESPPTDRKGYHLALVPPHPTVASLDGPREGQWSYRLIEGRWYLYRTWGY